MQEFYDNHEDALRVLTSYAYDSSFPPNPNAHVYLYQYLKRSDTSDRNLMKVLKVYMYILILRSPSLNTVKFSSPHVIQT